MVRDKRRCRSNFTGCLLGAVLLALVLMESTAFAAAGWFDCSVNLVGPGRNETFINLTDLADEPAFGTKWFLFPVDRAREMLAVALSAINSDKKVVVVVDPDDGDYPVISDIYLRAN